MIMVLTAVPLQGPQQGDRLRLQSLITGAERVDQTVVQSIDLLKPKSQSWRQFFVDVLTGHSPYLSWYRHEWAQGRITSVPDILCVFQLRLAPLALALPASYRILDLTDSLGLYRQSLKGTSEARTKRLWLLGIERDEVSWGKQFEEVWVSSARDQDWLMARGLNTFVVENTVLNRLLLEPGDPHHLLFVGNLEYLPNRVGLQQFLRTVWDTLRASGYRLTVVGRGSDRIRGPAIQGHGYVGELLPFYKAAGVVVSPIPMGAGSQNKILEALGWGRPVVAYEGAVAGLSLLQKEAVMAVNQNNQWLPALNRLNDLAVYRQHAQKGMAAVGLVGEPVAARLEAIHKTLH